VRRWRSALLLTVLVTACGKKGPPLPPLVKLPVAPAEFSIVRRASDVVVHLKIPTTNSDGSTPADLDRIEIYAYDGGAETPTADALVRQGTKVGTVVVNPPIDPDASQEDVDKAKAAAPPGGLDQGAAATVIDVNGAATAASDQKARQYFAVGINERGRRGVLTPRIALPLGELPPAPAVTDLTFDEASLTLSWREVEAPDISYRVYSAEAADAPLNTDFLHESTFVDRDLKWDIERCYVVRSVALVDKVLVESEPSAPRCVTPKDTFPPKAPTGLQAIAGEGAVNLIWDASLAPDLAGYLVLRAISPQTTPEPLSQTVITETTFRDTVPSGSHAIYAVQAVDKTGNRSPMSALVEETVR
jgi:hypothetical protein